MQLLVIQLCFKPHTVETNKVKNDWFSPGCSNMLRTKKCKRKPRFAPPKVPRTDDLKAHQCYGIVTAYHGGIHRNMDVTIYDSISNDLKDTKCKLKGSIRHVKCKQYISIGSLVVTDYEDVIIVFNSTQHGSIPDNIYRKLTKHHEKLLDKDDNVNEDDEDEDEEDELIFPGRNSDDEEDTVLFQEDQPNQTIQPDQLPDLDSI